MHVSVHVQSNAYVYVGMRSSVHRLIHACNYTFTHGRVNKRIHVCGGACMNGTKISGRDPPVLAGIYYFSGSGQPQIQQFTNFFHDHPGASQELLNRLFCNAYCLILPLLLTLARL